MSDTEQQPGIRTPLWIAGRFSLRSPLPTVTRTRLEKLTQTANGARRGDRLFVTDGLPNILELFSFALSWTELQVAGLLEYADMLQGVGQPFFFGLWKHFYPVYDVDGTTKRFLLPRLPLFIGDGDNPDLDMATPPGAWPDYPLRVTRYDKPLTDPTATASPMTVVAKTAATIETGNPSSGEAWVESDGHASGLAMYSTLRLGTAPASGHDTLSVAYIPAFRVVVEGEDPRAYQPGLSEPRGLKLAELG